MNRFPSTIDEFQPDSAAQEISHWLAPCTFIEPCDFGHTLIVYLSGESLAERDLGRLLVINGKCRNRGIKIRVQCPDSIAGQLANYDLDRLIWVDRDSHSIC